MLRQQFDLYNLSIYVSFLAAISIFCALLFSGFQFVSGQFVSGQWYFFWVSVFGRFHRLVFMIYSMGTVCQTLKCNILQPPSRTLYAFRSAEGLRDGIAF